MVKLRYHLLESAYQYVNEHSREQRIEKLLVTVIGSTDLDRDQRHAYYRMYDYCGNYGLSLPRRPVLGL